LSTIVRIFTPGANPYFESGFRVLVDGWELSRPDEIL
jgi:hypothetical protein